jgi:hypothetical protein
MAALRMRYILILEFARVATSREGPMVLGE